MSLSRLLGTYRPLRDHLPVLDGLRGLAVLLVVWHHLPDDLFGPLVAAAKFAIRPGYLGVDVFFVLSGFLITRILLHDRRAGRPLRGFLVRRFARIFPIYYLTLVVVGLWRPGTYIAWCATYLCNFYYAVDKTPSPMEHAWSLAVEEHFYLVWPFLAWHATPARLARWTVTVLLPAAVGLAILTSAFQPWLPAEADGLVYRITWYRMFSLALGGLVAVGEARLRDDPRRTLRLAVGLAVPAILLIPTVLLVDHRWIAPIMLVGFATFSVAVLLGALWLHERGGPLAGALQARFLRSTGRVSYGLYLYHVPLYFAFGLMGRPPGDHAGLGAAALAVGTAFLLAHLSYAWIERPILARVGSTLAARPRPVAPQELPSEAT